MIKRDLLRLHNAILAIEGRQFTVKFGYFIAKNKIALREEMSLLEEVRKPSEEWKTYDLERASLAAEYSAKDENNQPKIQNNTYIISDNKAFQNALAALKEKNKKVIEKEEKRNKEFEELLDEEVEFKGTKIDLKDIPNMIEPAIIEVFLLADLVNDKEK